MIVELKIKSSILLLLGKDEIPKPLHKSIDSLTADIAPDKTAYCYVLRPDKTENAFPQHDTCVFPEFEHDFEGNGLWKVVSGVKGKTQEISFQVNVQTIGKQSNQFNGNLKKKYKKKRT